jgi:aminopeptidase YwaD
MKNATVLLIIYFTLAAPLNAQDQVKLNLTTPEQLKKHVYYLASDSLLGRGFGTPQGIQAAGYIAGQFRKAGLEPLNGSYLHPFVYRKGILNITGNNVVGVIPGSDPALKDEYIVLGAHFDHLGWKIEGRDTVVYNGADDNASGSAAIIEIGRNLAESRSSLGRSVAIVAFDGEESGLVGSGFFLQDSVLPPCKIKLMFSLDMVGMLEANHGVDLKGIKMVDDPELFTVELAKKYGITVTKANGRLEQRTDTAPFGKAGIPAVSVFTGLKSPYHKPEDDADKLDYEGIARVTNYMTDATLQLSSAGKISHMPGPAEGEPLGSGQKVFRAGVRIDAGSSLHNYRDRYYKGKSIFAAGAGIYANIRLARFLNIQPEVLYETTGSQHEDGVFRTHSLTTPLSLQLITPEENMVRTFFQLGGYYSYHFGGSLGSDPIDFNNDFNNHEYGLSYGIGFEIMNMQWGVYVQRGLSDLNRAPDDRIRPESVYFMLGIMF